MADADSRRDAAGWPRGRRRTGRRRPAGAPSPGPAAAAWSRPRVAAPGASRRARRTAVASPSATPTTGSNATLANGTAAVASTIPIISRSDDPARRREDGADGRRSAEARPARRRPAPRARPPSPASRAARPSRFTTGEMSASRPNEASTTGSVAACAASETPRLSLNQRGRRPRVEPVQALGQRRRPGDEPGRGERRQLESGVARRGRARRAAAGSAAQPERRRGAPAPARTPERAARRRPSPRPAAPTATRPRTRCTRRRRPR